jgi:Outer membrane protein/protective antigen OMA87
VREISMKLVDHLKALINTTSNKTQFTFEQTDRLFYENNVDITYRSNYKEEDFARASSYKLNTFLTGLGVAYDLNPKLRHSIDFDYVIKDYTVTDSSTVATSIGNSEGENVSFVLRNNLYYSTLNSLMLPKDGNSLNYNNFIETPSSSSNGFVKNIITLKNYNKINNNIISIQAQIGNVISLNDNDILTDDKFSLGGRWLRGFDVYGAGPRNSRTSYVGGNNIITTKFDYSREITKNSDNPLYINLFNDYGLLWENKTKPTNNDNSLRSSFGFGIKYYSIIGPIGFSWGFPVMDEE